ncbi:MAG: hypothetical protein KDA57_11860 [Planctomycetales bacterium]|nr:hypothetical protein [Planctomycetales bacterium]
MNLRIIVLALLTVLTTNFPVFAETPPMPPNTNGGDPTNDGMKHIDISLTGGVVGLIAHDPPASPVVMRSGFGFDFTPEKFDVLENVYFNAQHGWLSPGGFLVELPPGGSIWMKRTGVTQPVGSTFNVYEGGNGAEGMAAWTMNEIYASDGDIWQWDGAMQHDYFTANLPGSYSMSFEVYIGDSNGNPASGFIAATTTFQFVTPEPAALPLALLGTMGLLVRRR